mmetsp:Transcript_6185/g.19122  ORF Transcript_6185/g.19122 Transcript_6185/m.19122 type:complete len:602 (-) Transcript_6185:294-2099(-)
MRRVLDVEVLAGFGAFVEHRAWLIAWEVGNQHILLVQDAVEHVSVVQPHVAQCAVLLHQGVPVLQQPAEEPQENLDDDASDDAVGNRVGQGHDNDGDEGRNGGARVKPVDVACMLKHERAHKDDGRAGGVRRDGRKDGRQKHGDGKAGGDHSGSHACAPALADANARLGKHSQRRCAQAGADNNGDTVHNHGQSLARPCALLVKEARKPLVDQAGHRKHGGSGVHEVEIQKGDERNPRLAIAERAEIQLAAGHADVWDSGALEEVLVALLTAWDFRMRREICRRVGIGGNPGDEGDEQDARQNGGVKLADHQQHHQHAAHDAQPHGCRPQLGAAQAAVVGRARGQAQLHVRSNVAVRRKAEYVRLARCHQVDGRSHAQVIKEIRARLGARSARQVRARQIVAPRPPAQVVPVCAVIAHAVHVHTLGGQAPANGYERGAVVGNNAKALALLQTDECQEAANPGGSRVEQVARNELHEHGAKSHHGNEDKYEALHKRSSQCSVVADATGAHEAHHSVGKVGVHAHGGRNGNREVCNERHKEGADGGGNAGGTDQVGLHLLDALRPLWVGQRVVELAQVTHHLITLSVAADGWVAGAAGVGQDA